MNEELMRAVSRRSESMMVTCRLVGPWRSHLAVIGVQAPSEFRFGTEADQESYLQIGRAEVIHELRIVPRFESMGCLDFQQHHVLDDEIGAKSSDLPAPEPHRQRDVLINFQTCSLERDHHRALADLFEVAVTQLIEDLQVDTDDSLGDVAMKQVDRCRHVTRLFKRRADSNCEGITRWNQECGGSFAES